VARALRRPALTAAARGVLASARVGTEKTVPGRAEKRWKNSVPHHTCFPRNSGQSDAGPHPSAVRPSGEGACPPRWPSRRAADEAKAAFRAAWDAWIVCFRQKERRRNAHMSLSVDDPMRTIRHVPSCMDQSANRPTFGRHIGRKGNIHGVRLKSELQAASRDPSD